MWDRIKFVIENIKSITLCGAIFWGLLLFTLEITGVIDIDATCGARCESVIEKIITKGNPIKASVMPFEIDFGQKDAPVTIKVAFLP